MREAFYNAGVNTLLQLINLYLIDNKGNLGIDTIFGQAYKYTMTKFANSLALETKVKIRSSESIHNGDWGIIKYFDGQYYYVAMFGGTEQPIFAREELVVVLCKG